MFCNYKTIIFSDEGRQTSCAGSSAAAYENSNGWVVGSSISPRGSKHLSFLPYNNLRIVASSWASREGPQTFGVDADCRSFSCNVSNLCVPAQLFA